VPTPFQESGAGKVKRAEDWLPSLTFEALGLRLDGGEWTPAGAEDQVDRSSFSFEGSGAGVMDGLWGFERRVHLYRAGMYPYRPAGARHFYFIV